MKDRIHAKILDRCDSLVDWYYEKLKGSYIPFYSSYDIRDAGFKISNVDGNIYPAGFNNICQMDKDEAPSLIKSHIDEHFSGTQKILLLSEDHLKNAYYWDNILTIQKLLMEAGFTVEVGMLSTEVESSIKIQAASGQSIEVFRVRSEAGQLVTVNSSFDLVISNNDFSNEYPDVDFSNTLMTPLKSLGWYRRQKYNYFKNYNDLFKEFAQLIDEDPWIFQVPTTLFSNFDVTNDESRRLLGEEVDKLISVTQKKYTEHGIQEEPYVFVKNNSGTYGLGVVEARNGNEVLGWNYKYKKKMKATKGGGGISQVIIQEGIPSVLTTDQATAEPVLYMVGKELVGGFLRTHAKKDAKQSLNSPGAVYKRLCLSDLKVQAESCTLENVYGWVARMGLLAISREAEQL